MAVPASPFCLSSNVAPYLFVQLKGRGDFQDGSTNISKTSVDGFIDNVSAQMLARFRRAGYVTPLVDLSGVSWPADQTDFLTILCVMGACSIISSPFVTNPSAGGGKANLFKDSYKSGLDEIFEIEDKEAGPFYGCQYRSMTPAERAVGIPAVPTTSHLQEMNDPAAHTSFSYWTGKSQQMQDAMEALLPLHNYDFNLNEMEKGPYV